MTHASVFSGIGGAEVAAAMLGWENLFHCEINEFGRTVLDYWFPNSKSYEDITTTNFNEWRGKVDVLSGGFPCQPFSYAGKRRGAEDDRYLWPHMFRCIDEVQPTWVIAENVAGITTMVEQGEVSKVASEPTLFDTGDMVRGQYRLTETFTLERICNDLESHGYAVQPVLVPACAVGAPHRRDRVFIVGRRIVPIDTNDIRHTEEREIRRGQNPEPSGVCEDGIRQSDALSDTESVGQLDGDRQVRGAVFGRSDMEKAERSVNATECNGESGYASDTEGECGQRSESRQSIYGKSEQVESGRRGGEDGSQRNVADTDCTRRNRWCPQSGRENEAYRRQGLSAIFGFAEGHHDYEVGERWNNFPTVSPVYRGNDGLPFNVDDLTLSFGKWRTEALKAYGNAIVPQVMYEIFRAIGQVEKTYLE